MHISIKIHDLAGITSRLHKAANGLPQTADTIVEVAAKDLATSIQGEVSSNIKRRDESTEKLKNSIQAEKIGKAHWGVGNTAIMPIYWAVQEFGATITAKTAKYLKFFRDAAWHKVKTVVIPPKSYLLKGFVKWRHNLIQLRLKQFVQIFRWNYHGKGISSMLSSTSSTSPSFGKKVTAWGKEVRFGKSTGYKSGGAR